MKSEPASLVENSTRITTRDQARVYYAAKLARAHDITVRGVAVTIVFERGATHLFSEESELDPCDLPAELRVVRSLGRGRQEVRLFSVARAQLMDNVLRAITSYTFAESAGVYSGREKVLLYGPPLDNGDCMRVVLRPGPGDAFTCVSAYPVPRATWTAARDTRRSRPARFPAGSARPQKVGPRDGVTRPGSGNVTRLAPGAPSVVSVADRRAWGPRKHADPMDAPQGPSGNAGDN